MRWKANEVCPDEQALRQSLIDARGTSQELVTHIENCPSCQNRLETMTTGNSLAETRNDWQRYSTNQSNLSPPLRPNDLGAVGQFAVESVIGTGGMGIVYRGWDTLLNRAVAIKLVKPDQSEKATLRFRRECHALAQIQHDHIVPVYSTGPLPNGMSYLVLPLMTGGMINTGTLRASNGGTMSLQGNGVFTNTGGLIEAAANSTVFHRTTNKGVLGGQLTGAGTHLVDVANLARFDSLAVNAYVKVRGGSRLAALGTITNNNLIRLNDSGVLEPVGTTTFAGNGTVEMTHANSGLYDASDSNGASDHLINGSTHKIRGLGRIGVFDTLQITNHGLIEANVSGGTLELQPDLSGLTNTGLLLATNGGTMNVSANGSGVINTGIVRATNGGTFTVNRTITSDGTIDAGAGSNVFGTFITNNGVIKGSGLLDLSHTLTNNGLISAGDSTGTLRINADAVVLHSTSQMLIEIAGTGAGQFDLLDFNFDTVGKLFLNGSLSVDLNGYLPSASDTFVVLTADNNNNLDGSDLQGTFSNVANGGTLTTLGGEGHFTVSYSDNSVLLSNFVSIQATIVDSFVNHVGYSGSGSSIDAGKVLAKEGVTPTLLTYDNLINTTRGINGVVFDFNNLPGSPTAADFVFQVSLTGAFDLGTNPVGSWTGAPAPSSVSVAPGSPDRVSIVWPDSAIANRWLRITVLANGNTGLSEPEVYYIGHLLGETTGPSGPVFTVSFADITPIRSTVGSSVDASSPVDIDKNGTVAFADISAMRASVGNQLTIITIPAAGGGG